MSPVWLTTTSMITFIPSAVGAGDERAEVGVRAEVRVDLREVEAPVAVVAGASPSMIWLHDGRRHPDRVEAEILDPLEAVHRVGAVPVSPLKSPPCK